MATDCGTPVQLQQQFLTLTNKATENAPNLSAPVVAPPPLVVLQLITAGSAPAGLPGPGTTFFTPSPSPSSVSPTTFGRDIQTSQPPTLTPLSPQ
jgi:hypothetical protein